MVKLTYHLEARVEIKEAAEYYEDCQEGLGKRFLVAVESAVHSLWLHPLQWRVLCGRFRRCMVSKFPYGIIYSVNEDEIFIAAVMHLNRKPGYWLRRI